MTQLGDHCALVRRKLTDQVEDDTRVQMHVATNVTPCGLSVSASSTSLGICAPEHRDAVYDCSLRPITLKQEKFETIRSGECKLWQFSDDEEMTQRRRFVFLFQEKIGLLK